MAEIGFGCSSVEEWLEACLDPARQPEDVPILAAGAELVGHIPWGQHAEELVRGRAAASDTVIVAADTGPAALCGALFAVCMGGRLALASDPVLAAKAAVGTSTGLYTVVALRDDLGDRDLLALLDLQDAIHDGQLPWHEVALFALVTARDLASLTRVVARLSSERAPLLKGRRITRSLSAADDAVRLIERTTDGATCVASRRELQLATLVAALAESVDAVAYHTHANDASAKAGMGAVLCGLRAADVAVPDRVPGTLACGRGHGCLRGIEVIPLRTLPARVLLLNACQGLRLRDSSLLADFNLGLAFADGEGEAYVSSVFSGYTQEVGSLVFLAALEAGEPVARATALLNLFSRSAEIERSSFITVGRGDTCIAPPSAPLIMVPRDARQHPIDTDSTFVEMVFDDAAACAAAQRGRLAIDVHGQAGSRVVWTARIEEKAGQEILRVFLFSYPEPIGAATVCLLERDTEETGLRAASGALAGWLDILRGTGLGRKHQEVEVALVDALAIAEDMQLTHLARLAYDGSVAVSLQDSVQHLSALAVTVRSLVLEELTPLLAGPFWLTNALASRYGFASAMTCRCPYCGGVAVRKQLKHRLSGWGRTAEVCMRCGIVSDISDDGPMKDLRIEVEEVARCGETIKLNVRVVADKEVLVCPRLSAHGLPSPLPSPPFGTIAPGADTVSFRLTLSPHLPPHQYSIKVLAASGADIAFAHRLLHVV